MIAQNADWVPYKLVRRDEWLCRWFCRAGHRYNEPFFSETVLNCLSHQPNGKQFASFSTLDFLVDAVQQVDPIAPTAFIFHVSRCGSTLLAQLLNLHPQHVVLSEAPLIDELLRLPLQDARVSGSDIEPMLAAVIGLLGDRRRDEMRLFVKPDSWHIRFAPLLRKLYPTAPFILLYRAPQEVIRSHCARRGMQAVPGLLEPALFDLAAENVTPLDADAYMGKVLAYFYRQFARLKKEDSNTLLLNYSQGVESMMQQLAGIAGFTLDTVTWDEIRQRSRYHSKYPGQMFAEQAAEGELPSYLQEAQGLYEELEGLRI
ncbi:MAG TPA: sulfotransferase [Burkholderiaceae bacterium]|jgi:hypothetical protein